MATSDRLELMEEVRLSKNPREREKYDNLVSRYLLAIVLKVRNCIRQRMQHSENDIAILCTIPSVGRAICSTVDTSMLREGLY